MSEGDSQKARAVSVVGVCLLSVVFGAFAAHFGTFPYTTGLEDGFRALEAVVERSGAAGVSPSNSNQWSPVRSAERGVVTHEPERTWGAWTVYSSFHRPVAYLIDMEGRVRHEWSLPFSQAWPSPPHVDRPVADERIDFEGVHLFANGDLLTSYAAEAESPYGYGLVRMNADSEVVWRYAARTHHDYVVGDDQSIHVLTQEFRDLSDRPLEGVDLEAETVLDEFVVRLSPAGEVEARWSLLEAVADSPMGHVLRDWHASGAKWDPLHANSVDVIGADFAEHHDFARSGQLMVSFRSLNAIGLVDPADGGLVWLRRGPWLEQHDPDPLPDGNVLIFDNRGHAGPAGPSRILEFDPASGRVDWSWAGRPENPFDSEWRGMQERLPNGNTLIVETVGGRLLEVTPSGEVVWSYRNPARAEDAGQSWVAHIPGPVQRVERGWLDFDIDGGR